MLQCFSKLFRINVYVNCRVISETHSSEFCYVHKSQVVILLPFRMLNRFSSLDLKWMCQSLGTAFNIDVQTELADKKKSALNEFYLTV